MDRELGFVNVKPCKTIFEETLVKLGVGYREGVLKNFQKHNWTKIIFFIQGIGVTKIAIFFQKFLKIANAQALF